MKVLWLSIDRSTRAAKIFDPLRKAMQSLLGNSMHIIMHSDWSRTSILDGGSATEPFIDTNWVNGEFDIVFTDAVFAYLKTDWWRIRIPKCILIEDVHGPLCDSYIDAAHAIHGFDHWFLRYRDASLRFLPFLEQHSTHWLPHSIDPEVFYPIEAKIPMVLQTGRTTREIYPMRYKVKQELGKEDFYRCIERPDDDDSNKWPVSMEYADLLRAVMISVSDCSIYGYPTMKIFEIAACGTTLACDVVPEMADLGFIEGQTFLRLQNDTDMREQFHDWLTSNATMEIGSRGADLVSRCHTVQHRSRYLLDKLKDIVDEKR
jgi:hypothetical protein